jgi:putative spermidine/putrescine transport system ATP-binding protein
MGAPAVKLEIRNMTKLFKNGDGVKDVNLTVHEGEFLTMLGPSGCGKTTILRAIGGFLDVDQGEILIDGQSVTRLPPEKRPTAMVFQSYNLWSHMTIYDNLAFGLRIRKVPKKEIQERTREMLELVKMSGVEKKYPSQLSGGQQQRVAIARALLLQPSVLLLDEPFSALDAKIRSQMREELKRIQEDLKITVVFVTHDQEEAMAISHRIVVMNKGVFEQVGTPSEIYDHPASRYVASFIGDMNFIRDWDGKVFAVRPEAITLSKEDGDGRWIGTVRTIMMLGHYAEIIVQIGDQSIKVFQPRHISDSFRHNDRVSLSFDKYHVF